MKTLRSFLETVASDQASRMGLQGDGHGDWYDPKTGALVAKTVKGRLKIFQGRTQAAQPDAKGKPAAQQQQPADVDQAPAGEQPRKGDGKQSLTIGFGRFNPPTVGHEKLMNSISSTAEGGDYRIYPSHSQDAKKNPLDSATKVEYMQKMFPDHAKNIVHDEKMRTIFDVLKNANSEGYANVNIVVGADRLKEFENLSQKYNGQLYNFDNINVVSAGDRDVDAEGIEGMSASKLRKAASEGDFETFRSGIPKPLDDDASQKLFATIRRQMGIEEDTFGFSGGHLWEIAPKYDPDGLREAYISKQLFNVGHWVENDNTGLIGKIIRSGANYIIALTESGEMFKSWIRDLRQIKR